MNLISIIAILIALITGGLIGTQISNLNDKDIVPAENNGAPIQNEVISEDYLALRPDIAALPTETISAEEKVDLIKMREEEKLAHDVYITLGDKWNINVFSNIARSELTHTEAIHDLLTKYNISDPVTSNQVGVFTNPELAKLYSNLTTEGEKSLTDALRVGALIEDLDIEDLEEALSRTDNADIKLVYNNLMRGSENHIRSFTRQLNRQNELYTPTYISTERYNEIINSDNQSGSGQRGNGKGRSF